MTAVLPRPQAAPGPSGAPDDAPFFVVGTDRSGTTLLRLMLNEHPRLHIPRESWFVSDLMDVLPAGRPLSDAELRFACDVIARHWRWRDWEIADARLRAAVCAPPRADLAGVVDRVFHLGAGPAGKPRWGDKTPGYVEEVGRLHHLFPRARFLHIVRDGRDVCLSLRPLGWRGRTTVDLARYWTESVQGAAAAGRALGPERYLELRYEDLVLETEASLRAVCRFLGEDFHERMLSFHERADREIAPWEKTLHAKLSRAPRASDVGRWRREMPRTERAVFEALAGAALEQAGYALAFPRSAGAQRLAARLAVGTARRLRRLGLMPAWRPRRRPPAGTAGAVEAPASAGPPVWRCERAGGPEGVAAHAAEWNALAHARGSSLFADATWMSAFCAAFLDGGDRVSLHLVRQDGALAAVVPLRPDGRIPAVSSVVANAHTLGPPLAFDETQGEVYGRALEHLLGFADVLDFGRLPAGGVLCRRLVEAARRRGLLVSAQPTRGQAIIDLARPWPELRAALSRGLRKNTERAERKLSEMGRLAFAPVEDAAGLEPLLDECFELETRGWKGESGSPIKSSPHTLRFYTELARAAAREGRFALYTLRLDGRLLAFEYCLRGQGQIALLKISYDPALARHSPGHVLRLMILRREAERGEIASYDMGADSAWKRHWASRVEPVVRLHVYGPGLASTAAYALGPGLRGLVRHSPALRRLAARARERWEGHQASRRRRARRKGAS